MSNTENTSSMKSPFILAAIPCLNEEKFVGDVIRQTLLHVDRVVVIDDGSIDRTVEIARTCGADVVSHRKCMGAGASTRDGFEYARKIGADILITLDGDGQHDPSEIPLLLEPIKSDKADLVIGSRFLRTAKIRAYRKFGINVITFCVNFGSNYFKFSDSQCSYRAHNKKAIESIDITDLGFGYSIEVLIQANKKRLRITEVPVSCIYHEDGSTINPVEHGISVLASTIMHRIRLLR